MSAREERAKSICRHINDPRETTDRCVELVRTLMNAMCWSPETEELAMKQMFAVEKEMERIFNDAIIDGD